MKSVNLETLLIILLVVCIIYTLYNHFKNMEKFANAEDVSNEMKKQQLILNDLINHDVQSQGVDYLPHLDIIKNYEESTTDMLGPLQNQVNNHTVEKEKELKEMEKYIQNLKDYTQQDFLDKVRNKNIGIVKSHNNGTELSVERLDNTNYMVRLNNGCLKVNPNNDYNTVACNSDDPDQKFSLEHVYNEAGYKNKLDPSFLRLEKIENVHYPFSMLKTKSNDNCVKNYHGMLSVEPCREFESQRWASVEKVKSCN